VQEEEEKARLGEEERQKAGPRKFKMGAGQKKREREVRPLSAL
jgi:hypothetical protein